MYLAVRLAAIRFGVPQLLLVFDHSKGGEAYLPLFVANPVRERGALLKGHLRFRWA